MSYRNNTDMCIGSLCTDNNLRLCSTLAYTDSDCSANMLNLRSFGFDNSAVNSANYYNCNIVCFALRSTLGVQRRKGLAPQTVVSLE